MRNLVKHTLNIFMLIALSVSLLSCEPEGKYKEYVYPEPVVDEVYPTSGYIASQVAITGTNFGDRMEPVQVFFGGIEVSNIISCKNNCIIVEVPEGAQSGDISLKVWTYTLESVGKYTVIPTPELYSVYSDNLQGDGFALEGDKVTIVGSAFGTEKSDVKVTINGKAAEILSVMDNEIKVRVPANYGSGLVVVTIRGYVLEGTALIDPSVTGDVTKLFLKNYCQPFQRVNAANETEWDDAIYWVKNANFTNNSLQFTDDVPEGMLTMVGNGKWDAALYQLASLPSGTYDIVVEVVDKHTGGGRYGAVFGVVKSEGVFPALTDAGKKPWNFADKTNVLCEINLLEDGVDTFTKEITITETTPVTIGFATMLANGNYVKVSNIKIIRK